MVRAVPGGRGVPRCSSLWQPDGLPLLPVLDALCGRACGAAGRGRSTAPLTAPAGRNPGRLPCAGQPDEEWEEWLNEGWDRAAAQAVAAQLPDLALQVAAAGRGCCVAAARAACPAAGRLGLHS